MLFPTPTADVLDLINSGAGLQAFRRWRSESVVDVPGVGEVRPNMRALMDAYKHWRKTGMILVVPMEERLWETMEYVRAQEEADRRKEEIFQSHCKRMGMPEGRERESSRCDTCDERKEGWMYYRPDATGYPTPVLFMCDEHKIHAEVV